MSAYDEGQALQGGVERSPVHASYLRALRQAGACVPKCHGRFGG